MSTFDIYSSWIYFQTIQAETKACRFGVNCEKEVCGYAHNIDQFKPKKCRLGNECYLTTCTYFHPWDVKEEFWKKSIKYQCGKRYYKRNYPALKFLFY